MWTWLLFGSCAPSGGDEPLGESAQPRETGVGDESAWGIDSDSAVDSTAPVDSTVPAAVATCPEGMVGVPTETPGYCIDAYEASGNDPVVSVAGAEPRVAVSFFQAREACALAPVVDADGATHGYKRLATDAEWEDAGDGQVGAGGLPYPYGEVPDDTACILPDGMGNARYSEAQPTGSAPACVSSFGAYDQIGNVWEWVDPGQTTSIDAWLAVATAGGLDVSAASDGYLQGTAADTEVLLYIGVVFTGLPVLVAEAGWLYLDATAIEVGPDTYAEGYVANTLVSGDESRLEEAYLPVELVHDGEGLYYLRVASGRDGEPFTSKRGCAYYTGAPQACPVSALTHEHPPGFDGTIGFRCAADPIPAGG